jgi:hypothetical protein
MGITLAGLTGQGQVQAPGVAKGKKVKIEHEGREDAPALTAAHAESEGFMDAAQAGHAQDARKAIAGLEAEPGPGTSAEPGTIAPEDFRRPYVQEGHAARSPVAEAPRVPPEQMPPEGRGILTPIALSAVPSVASAGGPAAQGIAQHMARSGATAGRPPIPTGSA